MQSSLTSNRSISTATLVPEGSATIAGSISLTSGSTFGAGFSNQAASTNAADLLRLSGALSIASDATLKLGNPNTQIISATFALSPHTEWKQTHFGTDATNPLIASDVADPDRDGVVNLLEWATATSPAASSVSPQSASASGGVIEFTYTKNKSATDVTFTVEWSDDFTTWSPAGVTQSLVPGSDNGVTKQWKATMPAGANGRRFVRLRVTSP